MMNLLKDLNERERRLLIAGLIVIISYLFYLLIYAPLNSAITERSAQLIEKKLSLTWMKSLEQNPDTRKNPISINTTKMLAVMGNQLSSGKLSPFEYELQQTPAGDVQLSFEAIPFVNFLTWYWQFSHQYLINIKELTAERSEISGIVKLKTTFHVTD